MALADGSAVVVRPIDPEDRETFVAGFGRTSPESRYLRFMTSVDHLSEAQIRYLIEVDHHDHEALIALDEASGDGVGIARFVRDREVPIAAEAAVIVVDEWQGRGLGRALCRLLAQRAREEGIERFTALLLVSNTAMLRALEALGPVRVVSRDDSQIAVEVDLPERGIGEHMTGILRSVAAGEFALARKVQ